MAKWIENPDVSTLVLEYSIIDLIKSAEGGHILSAAVGFDPKQLSPDLPIAKREALHHVRTRLVNLLAEIDEIIGNETNETAEPKMYSRRLAEKVRRLGMDQLDFAPLGGKPSKKNESKK